VIGRWGEEIPNYKSQIPNNTQAPNVKRVCFGHLEIRYWDLFGIWILGFEI
jgi:hypothetical protein